MLALAEGGRRFSSAFEDLIEVLLPWATLLAALAIIVIALPTRKPGSGSSSSSVGEFLALADERLQQLRFQQTESREKATGLKPAWLELGRKFARQTADRPMSLPELVESYRDFVEQAVTWWQGRNNGSGNITIAIDEVDRIASAEQAERFINEVKSIFGTRNCVYLVAVSEETLASFERRLVQGRSVLDNSFDEVLRIDSLDLSRTANLLSSRVVGIPLIFLVLCHCLSGGVPRELIRVARVMFDVRRSTQQRHIEPVATETVQRELQSLKRGFYTRISAQAAPSAERVGKILDNLSQTGWPGRTPVEIRRKAPSLLLDGDGQPAELAVACEELAAALSFYATVLDLFATHLDIISDSGSTRDSPLADAALIEDVAQTRRSLSVSAALARRRLDRIQESISS